MEGTELLSDVIRGAQGVVEGHLGGCASRGDTGHHGALWVWQDYPAQSSGRPHLHWEERGPNSGQWKTTR